MYEEWNDRLTRQFYRITFVALSSLKHFEGAYNVVSNCSRWSSFPLGGRQWALSEVCSKCVAFWPWLSPALSGSLNKRGIDPTEGDCRLACSTVDPWSFLSAEKQNKTIFYNNKWTRGMQRCLIGWAQMRRDLWKCTFSEKLHNRFFPLSP